GQVQDLGYQSTFPLLINVNGQPTYFMALKDASGVAKQFAMIDIQRYQNVATGATVAECQKNYEALLATNGISSGAADTSSAKSASGTIRTMAQAVIEGNSHFYVTLNGVEGIFDCSLPGLIEIVGYREGDPITFSYLESGSLNTVLEIGTTAMAESVEAEAQTVPSDEGAGESPEANAENTLTA
ncbi:MAG: Tat pathway signal sequence, partial [Eggerthellaceae bacterium]|nr:Tat pathway signal sequence [Eggerthellaceae bacterium]